MSGAFDRIWDLIKNDQRMAPQWMRAEEPVEIEEDLPEIRVNENPPQSDACCDDLIAAMVDLANRHGHESLLLGHDWIWSTNESCEDAVEFLDSAIDYGKYLCEEGGGWMDYDLAEGTYATEDEARSAWLDFVNNEQGQLEVKVLAEMREIKQQYEMCKGTEGSFGDEDMGFYASADPFERTWDLLVKAPLDLDSIKPVAYPEGEEDSDRMMHTADFIHPRTGPTLSDEHFNTFTFPRF